MKDHILLYYAALKFQHTRKVGPRLRMPTSGTLGSRTPKCLGGTWDPGPQKWDLGLRTPKYSSGTQNLGPPKWDPGPQSI